MRSFVHHDLHSEVMGTGWSLLGLLQQLARGLARPLSKAVLRVQQGLQAQAAPITIERRDPLAWWNGQSASPLDTSSARGKNQS